MSVAAAYLGIIFIWATTPLAIQWSGEDAGFIFGLGSRMLLGLLVCLLIVWLFRIPLSWQRPARRVYLVNGLGMYGAMMSVYWGAQYIPSGLISVLFGLTPLITGLFAARFLAEPLLRRHKLLGIALGLGGLVIIFDGIEQLAQSAWQGIAAILFSVTVHSAAVVGVKRMALKVSMHPMAINTGSLSLAVPLYLLSWLLMDGQWPETLSMRSGASIVYLGIVGSVLGFTLFYYALKHLPAGVMALITLITPVIALLLGQWLNGEPSRASLWWGTLSIGLGLILFQWPSLEALLQRVRRGLACWIMPGRQKTSMVSEYLASEKAELGRKHPTDPEPDRPGL